MTVHTRNVLPVKNANPVGQCLGQWPQGTRTSGHHDSVIVYSLWTTCLYGKHVLTTYMTGTTLRSPHSEGKVKVHAQSCSVLYDSVDYNLPRSSVHGIF